jgi:lipid-A-disaccharide synthase
MLQALSNIQAAFPQVHAKMVLPNHSLLELAQQFHPPASLHTRVGALADALAGATVAIASTGTVTMECAYFGVPTVALYKTSWGTFQIGKRLATVHYMAMPNLLANEEIFPEFIQDAATPENISHAAIELLRDAERRNKIKSSLRQVVDSLGTGGASNRAARAILSLLK